MISAPFFSVCYELNGAKLGGIRLVFFNVNFPACRTGCLNLFKNGELLVYLTQKREYSKFYIQVLG